MMFQADTAFAVELIALVAGVFLLIWAGKEGLKHSAFAKAVAYFTIAASILAIICTSYYTIQYWKRGVFDSPKMMEDSHMQMEKNMMRNEQ